MLLIKPFILIIALHLGAVCSADDTAHSLGSQEMVKRINERYDDFFRFRRAQEEREQKNSGSRDERKRLEKAHAAAIEKARQEYVRSRKARPSDEPLRLRHEAAEKARAAQAEMVRRRYVQQRDTVEQYLKKGRQIPELKEFDLEDY